MPEPLPFVLAPVPPAAPATHYDAANLAFSPTGNIAATTTQNAIAEVNSDLVALDNYPVLNVLKNSQSITVANTDLLLTFPTVVADTSSGWNSTNNQWVCPQTGTYLVGGCVEIINNTTVGNEFRLKVFKNNTQIHKLGVLANVPANIIVLAQGFCFLNFVINDLIDLRIFSVSASAAAPISLVSSGSTFQYSFMTKRIK